MEGLIFLALIFMFFLGTAQVLSAIVLLLVTKHDRLREHFGYYLIGVVLYFLIMYPLGVLTQDFGNLFFISYFFAGALGLMFYHFIGLVKTD